MIRLTSKLSEWYHLSGNLCQPVKSRVGKNYPIARYTIIKNLVAKFDVQCLIQLTGARLQYISSGVLI